MSQVDNRKRRKGAEKKDEFFSVRDHTSVRLQYKMKKI